MCKFFAWCLRTYTTKAWSNCLPHRRPGISLWPILPKRLDFSIVLPQRQGKETHMFQMFLGVVQKFTPWIRWHQIYWFVELPYGLVLATIQGSIHTNHHRYSFPQPRPLFCATSVFVCISSLCLANSLLQFKNWFSAEYPFGFLNETLLHVLV